MTDYYSRVLGEASASALVEFRVAPLLYWDWCRGRSKPETKPLHEGKAVHCALHEPDRFAKQYVAIPDMPLNSKDNKQAFLDATLGEILGVQRIVNGEKADDLRASVAAELARHGVYILTAGELTTLRGMVESLNLPCHRLARGLASRGKKELEIRWKDTETGVQCKARIDSWDEPIEVESDLKRTVSITERAFRSTVLSNSYHYQRAFYRRGLRALGKEVKKQYFVCGCPEPPYPWAVYDIPEETIDECDRNISRDLVRLAECLAKDEWPSLNNGEPVTLDIRPEHVR